jgi:phosphoribosylamine--glycine ligase
VKVFSRNKTQKDQEGVAEEMLSSTSENIKNSSITYDPGKAGIFYFCISNYIMNVLILGSGGREHAFAWKIAQSKQLQNLYIAPGNAGTANCGTNVNIAVTDFEGIKNLVWEKDIDLVLVGPEDPLVKGIHDYFLQDDVLNEVPVIGPKKDGAQLEGSKDFSKQFMQKYNVPTAKYETFTKNNLEKGYTFLESLKPPFVLKADGLAAGKGVLILNDLNEAKNELKSMLMDAKFGAASAKVVIEEFLHGIELSVFVLTDGKSYKILPAAKDYKRIGEGDTGLNTGGMGAVSPVPFADDAFIKKVEERVIKPTINGLNKEGIDYRGFIFIGLMNCDGDPSVIEYNCRMGDPETEVVIPRIESDLLDLLIGVGSQTLHEKKYDTVKETATTVVMVSGGYPGDFEKGKEVTGLTDTKDSLVFHSGTKFDNEKVVTNGGRVFAVTSLGNSIEEAVNKSFANAGKINYDKKYFRKDIGKDLINWKS